jgi:hypothetical protein
VIASHTLLLAAECKTANLILPLGCISWSAIPLGMDPRLRPRHLAADRRPPGSRIPWSASGRSRQDRMQLGSAISSLSVWPFHDIKGGLGFSMRLPSACRNRAAGTPSTMRWSKVRFSVSRSLETIRSPATTGWRWMRPIPSMAHSG